MFAGLAFCVTLSLTKLIIIIIIITKDLSCKVVYSSVAKEETSDNFLFDDSFDISNSLDSALYAGCELNNVTCTPIRSSTNLRTMEQTRQCRSSCGRIVKRSSRREQRGEQP